MTAHLIDNTESQPTDPLAGRGPVTFVITFKIKPDHRDEFHALLGDVLDAMRHETTFINAVLHVDGEDSSKVMLYETWADLDDVVNEQIHRDYRKTYWDRLPELLVETQQIQTWYALRGDFVAEASPHRATAE